MPASYTIGPENKVVINTGKVHVCGVLTPWKYRQISAWKSQGTQLHVLKIEQSLMVFKNCPLSWTILRKLLNFERLFYQFQNEGST